MVNTFQPAENPYLSQILAEFSSIPANNHEQASNFFEKYGAGNVINRI